MLVDYKQSKEWPLYKNRARAQGRQVVIIVVQSGPY
jgi:hypothetical protein